MKDYNQAIGQKIKSRRLELGIKTQAALAELLGVATSQVGRWESGKYRPSPEHYKNLLEVLKIDESYFLESSNEPSPTVDAMAKLVNENAALKGEIEKLQAERDNYKAKWEDVGTQAAIAFALAVLKVPEDRLSFVISEFKKDMAG